MILSFHNKKFWLNRFAWNPSKQEQKNWIRSEFGNLYTTEFKVAARLRKYADESAKRKLSTVLIERKPWAGRIQWPDGLKPRDFQIPAVKFALERNRSYIGLPPGSGKGVIASLLANALAPERPVVIVTPPGLVLTMQAELKKWRGDRPDVLVVPDSKIHDPLVRNEISDFNALNDGCLIADEAHRYKNGSARRTKALLGKRGLYKEFSKIVGMSGSPMPNRPFELYPILSRLAPETIRFADRTSFGQRYCRGYIDKDGRWNFKGASHLSELRERVHGKFMLRLNKEDILKDLPPKTEELILLDARLPPKIAKLEAKILRKHSPLDLMHEKLGSEHQSTYRKLLGELKVDPAISFLRDYLENNDEKIIVFAYHKTVVARLFEGLLKYQPLKIAGGMPAIEKHKTVRAFQTKKRHRLIVGNIDAMGLGFTLTAASTGFFVEYSWCPKVNEQAGDRMHRIGQNSIVNLYYMVFANSLDRVVLETDLRKRNVISNI